MEEICGTADIKVPLCHVEEGNSKLTHEYMVSAFGETFLIDNGLWESPAKSKASNGKKVPANNINLHFFGDLPDVIKSKSEVLLQSLSNYISFPSVDADSYLHAAYSTFAAIQ